MGASASATVATIAAPERPRVPVLSRSGVRASAAHAQISTGRVRQGIGSRHEQASNHHRLRGDHEPSNVTIAREPLRADSRTHAAYRTCVRGASRCRSVDRARPAGADVARDPGGCTGCRVKAFDFDRVATLRASGHQLRASGPAGACPVQDKLFLTVKVTQGGVTARGSWAKHTCTGQQQHRHVLLTTASGKTLKPGSALGVGQVKFTHNGKTLLTHTWTKKITLT